MNMMTRATDFARSPGDPKVVRTGPSVKPAADQTAQALGWFSLGLGLVELMAAPALARMLGMQGKENLIRAYGIREIAAGMTTLSTEKTAGLVSRVGGDLIDMATLVAAYRDDNPKKRNVGLAMAAVAGVTLLDVAAAKGSVATHSRGSEPPRSYRGRSGYPQGLEAARGAMAGKNSDSTASMAPAAT